ncbi:MAG: GMC family oxidoreductase N-terminal domain-containing protein, partial [Smithellaceae bacterium]|nr:GMC family oxidoreductase N-terminal domain-containing protein [Smithellaceae bacterium]
METSQTVQRLKARKTALALADGVFHGSPDRAISAEEMVRKIEIDLAKAGPAAEMGVSTLLSLINFSPLMTFNSFKTLYRMSPEERSAYLGGLLNSRLFVKRMLGLGLTMPFKVVYTSSPEVHAHLGVPYAKEKVLPEAEPRWMKQVFPAEDFSGDETIEADVVVVGTGAGGAVVAKELAEKGFAVAMVEEGAFHKRHEFSGVSLEMMIKLWRVGGLTGMPVSLGNCAIPIPLGKTVGGTTLINSCTCFRAPDEVLNAWVKDGLSDFAPEKMAPYFQRVEQHIHVETCDLKYVGPIGEVIAEGCEKLGYKNHGPLHHNTIDCDGQGVCVLGCPNDAKQSTNISYIPKALSSAAQLFTGFKVEEIMTEGRRATGVKAHGIGRDGRSVQLTCKARAVVVACGSLLTPTVLQKNKLVRGNKWVGKNLTIHPAAYVIAVMPGRDMKNPYTIPQGYQVSEFEKEGIMFEGATAPFTVLGAAFTGVGKQYTDMLGSYQNLAVFGAMIKDTSTGSVRPGPGGMPFIFYNLNKNDTAKLARATMILADIFKAAGATEMVLPTFNCPVIKTEDDLAKAKKRKWVARDLVLTAY